MKKIIFLTLICFAFTSAAPNDKIETETACGIVLGPLFGMSQQGTAVLYEWANNVSCPLPPCGPPGFIFYNIEVEYGYELSGSIVWTNNEIHNIALIDTLTIHSFSATINHRSKYMRFKVRVDPNSNGCNNPWSNWQIYQFY